MVRLMAPLFAVGCSHLACQWRRSWPQLQRRASHGARARPDGGHCVGGFSIDPRGSPLTRGRRTGAHGPRPPVPAHRSLEQILHANLPRVCSPTTSMAWLFASPSRPRSTMQDQEDPNRARSVRHRSRRSAASQKALKQPHAPRASDLYNDLMCEECVAQKDGVGESRRTAIVS